MNQSLTQSENQVPTKWDSRILPLAQLIWSLTRLAEKLSASKLGKSGTETFSAFLLNSNYESTIMKFRVLWFKGSSRLWAFVWQIIGQLWLFRSLTGVRSRFVSLKSNLSLNRNLNLSAVMAGFCLRAKYIDQIVLRAKKRKRLPPRVKSDIFRAPCQTLIREQ